MPATWAHSVHWYALVDIYCLNTYPTLSCRFHDNLVLDHTPRINKLLFYYFLLHFTGLVQFLLLLLSFTSIVKEK